MKKLPGYALIFVFAVLVLAGSFLLLAVPTSQGEAEFQASRYPGLSYPNQAGENALISFASFLLAYGGFYLLVRINFNRVLSVEYGYPGIVRFGFGLQMVSAVLFALSLPQPSFGSITMKLFLVVALLLPFAIRKLWLRSRAL